MINLYIYIIFTVGYNVAWLYLCYWVCISKKMTLNKFYKIKLMIIIPIVLIVFGIILPSSIVNKSTMYRYDKKHRSANEFKFLTNTIRYEGDVFAYEENKTDPEFDYLVLKLSKQNILKKQCNAQYGDNQYQVFVVGISYFFMPTTIGYIDCDSRVRL
jgi:hypothetical protein